MSVRAGSGPIVTVTPNPSVDRTVAVDELTRGEVIRAVSGRVDPGGKGVNVSRALVANGTASTAVVPLGGSEGLLLGQLLGQTGVTVATVALAESTRANISVVEPDGTTTKINEPGPRVSSAERAALIRTTVGLLADRPAWLVVSGSLPPGLDADFYAELISAARAQGIPVAADTTGTSLRAAADAGADLLKPNDEELAEVVGRALTTIGEVIEAAQELRAPHGQILVSLGARGALLVGPSTTVMAHARCDAPLSTVGAGDSLLAGFLHAGTRDAAALATGVSWGTAAVGLPGSQMPTPADVAAVSVTLAEPPIAVLLAGP